MRKGSKLCCFLDTPHPKAHSTAGRTTVEDAESAVLIPPQNTHETAARMRRAPRPSFCSFCGPNKRTALQRNAPIIWQFFKNSLFQKRCKNCFFFQFIFFVLSLLFEISLLCWLEHYKNRGFGNLLCFCCSKRRKNKKYKKMEFVDLVCRSKNSRFVTHLFSFQKEKISWTPPNFCSVFGVRVFWAKLSKRKFWTPTKTQKFDW